MRHLLATWVLLLTCFISGQVHSAEKNRYLELFSSVNQITSYLGRGKFETALELAEQTRSEFPEFTDEPILLMLSADAMYALGRYQEALKLTTRAENSYQSIKGTEISGISGPYADMLNAMRSGIPVIAAVSKTKNLLRLGRIPEGVETARNAENNLALWTGDAGVNSVSALTLANTLIEYGQIKEAESLVSRVESVVSTLNFTYTMSIIPLVNKFQMERFNKLIKLQLAITKGTIALAKKEFPAAIEFLRDADLLIQKEAPNSEGSLLVKSRLINAYNKSGNFTSALASLPEGYSQIPENDAPRSVDRLKLDAEAGYAYFSAGHMSEATVLWQGLVNQIEKKITSLSISPEARRQMFETWLSYYRMLAILHVKNGEADKAMELSELSKARSLLETVTASNAEDSDVLPEDKRARLKALNGKLAQLHAAAVSSIDPKLNAQLKNEELEIFEELYALKKQLFIDFPRYASLNKVAILTRANADTIPAGSALISYMLVPHDPYDSSWKNGQIWAFVIKGDGKPAQAIPLGEIGSLEKDIRFHINTLSSGPSDGLRDGELSKRMSRLLIEPLLPILDKVKSLIISPDGPLALLPFETLPLGSGLLVSKYDISHVQSLSIMNLLKKRQKEYSTLKRRDLFAMGGALYEADNQKTVSSQDRKGNKQQSRSVANRNNASSHFDSFDNKFNNLPGTEIEIRDVAKLFPDNSIYLRQDATESKLLKLNQQKALANYRYLLFSAHGYLSTDVPELSALVLGQIDKEPNTDGFITAAKWPSYVMNSDLLVLSACETGVGEVVYGEGVMGLPYALYVAGNRSTILSLWPVEDDGTAHFMKTFFGHLKAGKSQAEAINTTKREMLKHPQFKDMFFWAPFVLYGV